MPTTLDGKKIVTQASGHKAITPPAISLGPPPPPAGPVPMPFPYMVQSSTGSRLHACSKVNGSPVACKDNVFDVEPPANVGTQATGSDVVSHKEVGKAKAAEGDTRLHVDGMAVCTTGHRVMANMMTGSEAISQVQGPWIEGGGMAMGSGAGDASASVSANGASDPDDALKLSDPVAVATGRVIDDDVDVSLPGLVPFVLGRAYTTANAARTGALGRGGWSHAFEQTIAPHEERPEILVLFAADGRRVFFEAVDVRASTLHRRERLRLTRTARNAYDVYDLRTRLTRSFAADADARPALLRSIRDANGSGLTLEHDGERLVKVIDTCGREVRFTYAKRRVTRVEVWAEDALWLHVDYAYGPGGELASVTDALGNAERYAYDGRHRMEAKTLRNGVTFRFTYEDEGHRCVSVVGDGGLQPVTLFFDDEAKTTTAAGTEATRRYTWDADGYVVREETFDGAYVVETDYDADHFVVARRDAAGNEVTFAYDALGNLVKATDPAGNATEWVYEGELLVAKVHPDGQETKLAWGPRQDLERIAYPGGLVRTIEYDHRGRYVRQKDDGEVQHEVEYDARHNVKSERRPRGGVTRRRYDALGRTIESVDPQGVITTTTYDALSRPIATSRSTGARELRAFDARGLCVRREDERGRVWEMKYAGTGVLVEAKDPTGQATRYEYDALERLRAVVNARLETHEIAYDRAGRVVEEKTFDDRRLRYTWDLAGRLARIDPASGGYRAFTYDALGLVLEDKTADSIIRFTRDALGQVEKAVVEERGAVVTVEQERDAFGRVVVERTSGTGLAPRAAAFAYDARGRRTRRELPNGEVTRYAWDDAGGLAAVEHAGVDLTFAYDPSNRRTQARFARGKVVVTTQFDGAHHVALEVVDVEGVGRPVERRRHYGDGRLTAIEDAWWGTERFTHDAAARLISRITNDREDGYQYDGAGAMTASFGGDPATRGAVVSRPGDVLARAGSVAFTADDRHRRARETNDGRAQRYTWDERDRLREIRLPSGERVVFTYDAFGRRVQKRTLPAASVAKEPKSVAARLVAAFEGEPPPEDATDRVDYLWDGDALALETRRRGDAEVVRAFVHEPGEVLPLLASVAGEVLAFVTDPVGVPRELIDARGEVAWAGRSSPFGAVEEERVRRGGDVELLRPPFRLLGHVEDADTHLTFTRYRAWDARVARWLSPDPIGIAGGLLQFALQASPLHVVDPLGLSCYLLNDQLANTFKDGKYRVRVLEHDEVMWRAGVKDKPYGQFFDHEEPVSVAKSRQDKAILPVWPSGDESPIDGAHQHVVKAGTVVYDGEVAPQKATDGTVYKGGTNQVVVPYGVHSDALTPIGKKDLN